MSLVWVTVNSAGAVTGTTSGPGDNAVQMDTGDSRYVAWQFGQSAAGLAQAQFAAAKAAGLAVQSTGTPAFNSIYALDDTTRANLTGIVTGIAEGKGLPGGAGTFEYLDLAGAPHAFDSAGIVNLAKAIEDYYYTLTIAEATAAAGGSASWPSATVTIA